MQLFSCISSSLLLFILLNLLILVSFFIEATLDKPRVAILILGQPRTIHHNIDNIIKNQIQPSHADVYLVFSEVYDEKIHNVSQYSNIMAK